MHPFQPALKAVVDRSRKRGLPARYRFKAGLALVLEGPEKGGRAHFVVRYRFRGEDRVK